MANRVYEKYLEAFKNASQEELSDTAVISLRDFILASESTEKHNEIMMHMVLGAKIGISSKTGKLNEKEMQFAAAVFSQMISSGSLQKLFTAISEEVDDMDLQWLDSVCQNPYSMEMLKYILAFAYSDGEMNEALSELLEDKFGFKALG